MTILAALFWGTIFLFPANTFSEELSLLKVSNDITWNSEIKEALISFEEALEGRELLKIDESISHLKKIRNGLHTENLSFVSELLLKRGEVLMDSGEERSGIQILERVQEAFPADYRPYFRLSKIYLSFGNFHPISGISRLWGGFKVYLSSETQTGELKNFILQVLLINLTITAYMVVLIFFAKHFREAVFDLARIFHLSQKTPFFKLTAVVFFMIPLRAGGFFALIITLSFLVWPYLKSLKERAVIIGFTLLVTGFSIWDTGTPALMRPYSTHATLKLEEFSKNSWDRETLRVLEKLLEEEPDSIWLNIARGLLYKWNGESNRSYAIFNRLYKKFPDNPEVLINLGNYSVTSGKLKEAKKLYEHALSIDPNIAEARYNLSITLDALMDFEPAKEEFDKAYGLDSKKIQDFLNMSKDKVGLSLPIDMMPTGDAPSSFTLEYPEKESNLTPLNILTSAFKSEGSGLELGILLLYISIFLGLRRRLIAKPIEECNECGTILYSGSQCRICTALMLPHSRVEPLERKKVVESLGNYQLIRRVSPIVFNLLGPGSGLVFKDKILTGVTMLMIHWVFFLALLLCFLGENTPIYTETAVFLLLSYYLIVNIFLLRER